MLPKRSRNFHKSKEICVEMLVAKATTCKRVEVRYGNLCDCNFLPLILSFKSTTRFGRVLVNTLNRMKDRLYTEEDYIYADRIYGLILKQDRVTRLNFGFNVFHFFRRTLHSIHSYSAFMCIVYNTIENIRRYSINKHCVQSDKTRIDICKPFSLRRDQ